MTDAARVLHVPAKLPDPAERIAILDILRGFALFGMIFIHFHQMFRRSTEGVPAANGSPPLEFAVEPTRVSAIVRKRA